MRDLSRLLMQCLHKVSSKFRKCKQVLQLHTTKLFQKTALFKKPPVAVKLRQGAFDVSKKVAAFTKHFLMHPYGTQRIKYSIHGRIVQRYIEESE